MIKIFETVFGVIGIGIIFTAIFNIIFPQKMWTRQIAALLGVYSSLAFPIWREFIFVVIEVGCILTIMNCYKPVNYYFPFLKISGKIEKIEYEKVHNEAWCYFFIDKHPAKTFWIHQEIIEQERLRKDDEVVFWAKRIFDEVFMVESFSKVKQIDIVQTV